MKKFKKIFTYLTVVALLGSSSFSQITHAENKKTIYVVKNEKCEYANGNLHETTYSYNDDGLLKGYIYKFNDKKEEDATYSYDKKNRIKKITGKYYDDEQKKFYKYIYNEFEYKKDKLDMLTHAWQEVLPDSKAVEWLQNNSTFEWKNGLLKVQYLDNTYEYSYNKKAQVTDVKIDNSTENKRKIDKYKFYYDKDGFVTKRVSKDCTLSHKNTVKDSVLTEVTITPSNKKWIKFTKTYKWEKITIPANTYDKVKSQQNSFIDFTDRHIATY